SRTIVSRKVDAIVKFFAGDRRNHRNVPQIASRDQNAIDVRNGGKQFAAFVRNREGDVRIRIVPAQGGNCRRGQNQIADSLELQEKDFHKLFTVVTFRTPKRSAVTDVGYSESSRHWYSSRVCVKQSRPKMVPGKILHDATSGSNAHFFNDLRMPIQMLKRRRDCAHISRLYDDSVNSVTHYVARLARSDLRQSARRRFV